LEERRDINYYWERLGGINFSKKADKNLRKSVFIGGLKFASGLAQL